MSGTRAKATALVAALQLSVALAAFAQEPDIARLFPAQPQGWVTDVAGVIDPASEARIEDLSERLRAATGAEIAVVTLPSIAERDEAEERPHGHGVPPWRGISGLDVSRSGCTSGHSLNLDTHAWTFKSYFAVRRAAIRNSRLPLGPVIGLSVMPRTCQC